MGASIKEKIEIPPNRRDKKKIRRANPLFKYFSQRVLHASGQPPTLHTLSFMAVEGKDRKTSSEKVKMCVENQTRTCGKFIVDLGVSNPVQCDKGLHHEKSKIKYK